MAETGVDSSWMHFSASQPKQKRAGLVCTFCHSKKSKCDLATRRNLGHDGCTRCKLHSVQCCQRTSRRGRQAFNAPRPRPPPSRSTQDSDENLSPLAMVPEHAGFMSNSITVAQMNGTPPKNAPPSTTQPPNAHAKATAPPKQASLQEPSVSSSSTRRRWSRMESAAWSHHGEVDTGFLHVWQPEEQHEAVEQDSLADQASEKQSPSSHDPHAKQLQQAFCETYFEYCYMWCPVLERDTVFEDLARSPMLSNALALAASHIQPPLLPHAKPETYYNRARNMFYNDEELDFMAALRGLALFYWWAPRAPATTHRHSSWWWTSVIIRHAQQMNFHIKPNPNHPLRDQINHSLRRRLWWTVFSRERLTALCQSKPSIIDPADCSIEEPTLSDFPPDADSQHKGEIFIHWTRLCTIMGMIAKNLSRSASGGDPSPLCAVDLRQALVDWVTSLPPNLQLPIGSACTESFDKDVHQLHLPYLTTIIVLFLKRSDDLPQAMPPAILAASCIVRILRDILSRGNARFLMAITCWYAGAAFTALMQASRVSQLAQEAEEGLELLVHVCKQLQQMWGSAKIIQCGFERLLRSRGATAPGTQAASSSRTRTKDGNPPGQVASSTDWTYQGVLPSEPSDSFDWMLLFPFVTPSTNKIAECLISERGRHSTTDGLQMPDNFVFQDDFVGQYDDLMSGVLAFDVGRGDFDLDPALDSLYNA